MRYLIISDIHANRPALEAVLKDAGSFDKIWCLGDMVGYGPDPNECVERIQDFDHICLAGNHDWAALGRLNLENFNIDARMASAWTQQELNPATHEYLEALPTRVGQGDFTLVHGSPREPIWEYLLDAGLAAVNFRYFSTRFCIIGHTHIPIIFALDEVRDRCHTLIPSYTDPIPLGAYRMILNPGSVGQPRDGDPRASYAILDTDAGTWEPRRVSYPIEITQERMRARNMPRRLIRRLESGR
ncbi:MAG TPA: metallophosphoesterase [Anaerolineales bacterium]|nr:metallophosphoesterase [Anaerolineae bacterium]HIQ02427.1 metallophosphoesterase [Anaerolineales bacterium]